MTDTAAGSKLQAALWVLAAALAFSVVYASGKLAGGAVPALVIVWVRYLSGFVTVSAVSLVRHGSLRPGLASRKLVFHALRALCGIGGLRSEEHTSELQSLMRISYAVFCLKKKKKKKQNTTDYKHTTQSS